MTRTINTKTIADFEQLKRSFGANEKKLTQILRELAAAQPADAESLIRLHETLLFFRAYPPSLVLQKKLEEILKGFAQQVEKLRDADVDLSPLDNPEVSGIVSGSVTTNFSYRIARWLTARFPNQVSIDWDWFEEEDRFGAIMPRFLPLLADDAMVEAHVPFRQWLKAACGRENELVWLLRQFASLQVSEKERAELYDSLKLHLSWKYGVRSSRTSMRLSPHKSFVHDQPLVQRRQVSLVEELNSKPIPVSEISAKQGVKIIDLARETSAVRYRELHGFTFGDSRQILRADLGRGTEAFVMGVPPTHRLPLRAYHAATIFKNGVPVAYFEGLSICERMESGFNLYYTFRDGETAWLYARILHLMQQLLGVTVFSIDPYQIGHENEEGIASGAFWFYRKLGFRPVQPELLKLTQTEEDKMTRVAGHRTSAAMLRKLASGHLLFELAAGVKSDDWDNFEVRKLALVVQRRMAREFNGHPEKMRAQSIAFARRVLGVNVDRWRQEEQTAFENLSLVFAMIPGFERWNTPEKQLAVRIIRAKAGRDETRYLRLMQKHAKLRQAMIELGSGVRWPRRSARN